jgi:nucleotide-binding universal stress UspA family protein
MAGVVVAELDDPDAAPGVLAAAARLARLTQASHINVLAIRTPPLSTITTEQVLTPQVEERVRAGEHRRVDLLKATYDNWAATTVDGTAIGWVDVEGLADLVMNEWGGRADFIVVKRPTERRPEQERRALRTALFDTGRPVLMVPFEPSLAVFGRRIAIAWRDDGRTIKAVLSALRLAGQAEEIHVLAGTRDTGSTPRLPEILEEHGIEATLHLLPVTGQQAFGEDLLVAAHRLGCDMLVMGAFARHPARSLILGGVTRYMLSNANLPVLMRR